MVKEKKESAMMQQWRDLKAKHPDAVLLFRCGDFYEAYEEDAKVCAKLLGITLTSHNAGYSMAGFPYHALDTYLPKLIRAGKRVAICDQLNEIQNSKIKTNMEKKMKAADLIGKVIIVGENIASINIKSAEGDTLQGEFRKGDAPAISMPIPMSQLEKMLTDGVWKLQDAAAEPKGSEPASEDTVEEVNDAEPKVAKEVSMEQPAKPEKAAADEPKGGKPKQERPKPKRKAKGDAPARLRYETYENKRGKTCAKIVGFAADDEAYLHAADLHGSATYERDKQGGKALFLLFGPRYAEAAKEVCAALNDGKSLSHCKAIIDATTEERQQRREEWKAKRAAYQEARANGGATEKEPAGYTAGDVAAMLKRVMAGEDIPEDIKKAMTA